ncbi:MAG TPA: thioredoxin domain-containing protein [Luteimonas sp.]|nr:thioredoxin domain-containing protein [Luteimonas sp.]HRO26429.1 thioredoxin domain-containing protein [Luteimonas sp.]HRP73088.1 thioredoxin domain-containing protein [Luteimonas sp.]
MSSNPISAVTSSNFMADVVQRPGVSVVRFWATWCPPCRQMAPIYGELAQELGDRAHFSEVDIDHAPDVAGGLGIRSVPTMLIFKDGELVDGMAGLAQKAQYHARIQAQL